MELIIGGSFQGKLDYAKRKLKDRGVAIREEAVIEGADWDWEESGESMGPLVLNHLHLFVRKSVQSGAVEKICPALQSLLANVPDCIIICDEVGCGVVPIDRTEREYRETVGRILCFLVQRADRVERIMGGLPLRIK